MDNFPVTNNFSSSINTVSTIEQSNSILTLQQTAFDLAVYTSVNSGSSGITTPLERSHNFILKRCLDIIISIFLIIVLLSWLLPLLALLIKLDSKGPVFFLQKRNKNGGRSFTCIKFRSMIVNKEADILSAVENDKRITRVGKFIRHYHLDELPQLFNVLIGDMSLIGPRPHMISENLMYEKLVKEYVYRHVVKPGMTGLAQSHGNFGATSDLEKVEERVALDLQYIRQWSVVMDIQIMYRTCKLMFRS